MPPEEFLKLGALKLDLQDSENKFDEIFHMFKTTSYGCIF